jgi:hypothetical protein
MKKTFSFLGNVWFGGDISVFLSIKEHFLHFEVLELLLVLFVKGENDF